jgi:lipopolysaccharide export LptBFGC system permease protein LptF
MTKFFEILGSELPKRLTMDVLPAGVMHEVGGWRVYFGSKDRETATLYDIVIIQEEEDGVTTTYHAESARYVKDEKGHWIVLGKGGFVRGSVRSEFASVTKFVEPPGTKKVRGARRMLSLAGLVKSEKELATAYEETGTKSAKDALEKERREIGERIGFPLAAFAVAFVAAPLGVRARRSGRSYTFAMGFGIILTYYVLMVLTESSSLKSLSTNIVNASIPNMILFVTGLYLIWRVDRI